MSENKKQSLLTGAGILAIATVLVKIVGAVYKIPLVNLISVEGYGYFQGAYAVYTPLYSISMAGLPVAVSKLVSQNMQLGRVKDAKQLFHVARKLFLVVGLVGTLLLAAISVPYSKFVGAEMNYIAIIAVAPCILFCCCMSSFRGYYEGLNNMTPTGVSQVIEAIIKLTFGLSATYVAVKYWTNQYSSIQVDGVAEMFGVKVNNEAEALAAMYPYAAAVAILGVTLGSMFGLVYLFVRYKRKGFGFTDAELAASPEPKSNKVLRKEIIMFALPVALSSLILNVSNIVDDITIRTRLAEALKNGMDVVKGLYGQSFIDGDVLDENIANYLYGTHGSVINLKNLIPTITLTLGISAIPVLSKAWSKYKNSADNAEAGKAELRVSIESVLRVASMIALPAGIGMASLAKPIIELLYPTQLDIVPIAVPMLQVYGFGMILFSISSPITNMLQAIGKAKVPLISIAIGSLLKVGMNWIMIANPEINIHGAPISTTICYVVMVAINITVLLKFTKVRINFVSVFLKPLIAAAACGAGAYFSNMLLTEKLALNGKISAVAAICVGGALYAFVLLVTKGIAKDDVLMLPKGDKIAKVLEKLHVLG